MKSISESQNTALESISSTVMQNSIGEEKFSPFKGETNKNDILCYFKYAHLPEHLKAISKPISDLAHQMSQSLLGSAEKTAGLRKLLEAKDCFVRAALDPKDIVRAALKQKDPKNDMGEVSDGDHTFNELYFHRMTLFSIICNTYAGKSWKSKLHDDGTMFDGYFIVGIETPLGQFTYHYKLEYWDVFAVNELAHAPEWDGHTSNDILRLYSLLQFDEVPSLNNSIESEIEKLIIEKGETIHYQGLPFLAEENLLLSGHKGNIDLLKFDTYLPLKNRNTEENK